VLNRRNIYRLLIHLGSYNLTSQSSLFKAKEFRFEAYISSYEGDSWLKIHLVKPWGTNYKVYDSDISDEFEHGFWSYSFFKIVQEMEKEVAKREAEALALLLQKQKAKDLRAEKEALASAKYRERSLNRINNYFNKKRWK